VVGEGHQHTGGGESMLLLKRWCDKDLCLTPSIAKGNQFDSERTDKWRALEDLL
jgi:hypothetical protein